MKAVVVSLVVVVVLAVLAWPCAAQDHHHCSAADTVVGAGEQKTVANITRITGTIVSTLIYLHPESAFEGVLVASITSSGTRVGWWFPAYTHCFTHNTDWGMVLVYCTQQACNIKAGDCRWHCRDTEPPAEPLSVQVVAVGASRWRTANPRDNCTVTRYKVSPPYRDEPCSPASKHPTPDSPSTTTTTTTDSPFTTTIAKLFQMGVAVVVVAVLVMVVVVVMVMKIHHSRPGAPGAAVARHFHAATQTPTAVPDTPQGQGYGIQLAPLPVPVPDTSQCKGDHLYLTPLPVSVPDTPLGQDEESIYENLVCPCEGTEPIYEEL